MKNTIFYEVYEKGDYYTLVTEKQSFTIELSEIMW